MGNEDDTECIPIPEESSSEENENGNTNGNGNNGNTDGTQHLMTFLFVILLAILF